MLDEDTICFYNRVQMNDEELNYRRRYIGLNKGKDVTKEVSTWEWVYTEEGSYSYYEVILDKEDNLWEHTDEQGVSLVERDLCLRKVDFSALMPLAQQTIYSDEGLRARLNLKYEDVAWEEE
jgi:hypothetical protein